MNPVILGLRIINCLAGALLFCICAAGEDQVAELIARVTGSPFDERALYLLEEQPTDARTIPALEGAFHTREAKSERQAIAITLIRLGSKSSEYFEFLAQQARQAVEDRTPFFLRTDVDGQGVPGQFDPAFEQWCHDNHCDARAVASAQWMVYPKDVVALAQIQDPRATAVLRRGLESPYPVVVAAAVQGLGRLQDRGALPLIAKAVERLPSARAVVGQQLPWYSSAEALSLAERLVPDAKERDRNRFQVEQLRLAELARVTRRTTLTKQK